jgi:GNAT superfamily N-acetyltransferase
VAREQVERAALNSALVLGAFSPTGVQIGYARVISDKTRFAYLCDVVVDEDWRGQGVGRALVRFALGHADLATVKMWTLATRDAHGVYARLGFRPVSDPASHPEIWMMMFQKASGKA